MNKILSNPLYILAAVIVLVIIVAAVYFLINGAKAQVVATGDKISVYYTGTLANGTQFGSNVGEQPLAFTVGTGQVIPGFDQAVIGMQLNQTKTITLPVNEAYGPVNPALIIVVSKSQFGNQTVVKGMTVTQTESNGQQAQGTVIAVNATNATLDFNSPLAGQALTFMIKVIAISGNSTSSS